MSAALPAGAESVLVDQPHMGPFVGPRPFELADRHLFFGREREAHEVSSLVLANRLFILYAMSGAGKTSLVNAGVLPLVQDEIEVLPTARFLVRDPGATDAANVYTYAALSCWTEPDNLRRLQQATLSEYLESRLRLSRPVGGPKPRLLVFDQFEELFTAYPERWQDRAIFLEQLAEASEADPGLRVLVVLREDFLSRMLAFADAFYSGLKDRYFLEPLRKPAARLAIMGPIGDTGRSFEPGAVDDLVRRLVTSRVDLGDSRIVQVEGEFVEPVLLQVVCQKLWAELPAGASTITAADIRDVDTSLADFYSAAIRRAAALGEVPERQIREWVKQNLLTRPGGTRGTVYAGAETTAGLPNKTVDLLVGTLLRAEFRAGARWLEITHDSLLGPIEQSNAAFFRAEGPLSRDADALALAVAQCLQSTVMNRRLNDPAPLDIAWSAAEPAFMDSWEEVRTPETSTKWIPPAGVWLTEPGELSGNGKLMNLIDRLPGRRLVVVGEPGSGKTMLLVQFVLDLLARRATGGPVPVLVSAATWDPAAEDLHSWLTGQLAARFPRLLSERKPDGAMITAGSSLIAADLILPVIDDLDEIAPGARGLAISRINDALRAGDFLVAACRTQEYEQMLLAADGTQAVVRSAAVIQLEPLAAGEADRYLRACAGSAESVATWEPMLSALGTSAPVGQALVTPLMVGLARSRYSRGPSGEPPPPGPDELCDPRLEDRGDVEELLFGSFTTSVTAGIRGRWPLRRIDQWLSYLARNLVSMTGGDSFAWWQVARATPRYVLGLVTGLVVGLLAAALCAEALAVPRLVAGEDAAGVLCGLILGFSLTVDRSRETGAGSAAALASASPSRTLARARRTALIAGAVGGVPVGVASGLAAGFSFGVFRGIAAGLLTAVIAGLISAAYYSGWPQWQLARAWLAFTGVLPWRSMGFLAYAHTLGALRQQGPRYQFRYEHLRLRLAARPADPGDTRAGQNRNLGGRPSWDRIRAPGVLALVLLLTVAGSVVASDQVASEHIARRHGTRVGTATVSYSSSPAAAFHTSNRQSAEVVAFSPNGRLLAVGDAGGAVSLWGLTSHRLVATLNDSPRAMISSIAFDSSGTTLAVGALNGVVTLWNLTTRRKVTAFSCAARKVLRAAAGTAITSLAFASDRTVYAATAVADRVFACSANTAAHPLVRMLPVQAEGSSVVTALSLSHGAMALAIGSSSGQTFLLARSAGGSLRLVTDIPTPSSAVSVAFSPDERTLAIAAPDGTIRLFDTRSVRPAGSPLADPGRSNGISAVAFSPDGRLLAPADGNGSTYVHDVKTGKLVSVLSDPSSIGVSSVAFGPDGSTLATTDLSGATYVWPTRGPRHGSKSSSSSAPARAGPAVAISALLVESARTRSQWNFNAIVIDVQNCSAVGSAITQIRNIAKERAIELNKARHLMTGDLARGATIKSQLIRALRVSLTIDNDYLSWAQQQQDTKCATGINSSYYDQATTLDAKATNDKAAFVHTWNPVAAQYGLQQFTAGDI